MKISLFLLFINYYSIYFYYNCKPIFPTPVYKNFNYFSFDILFLDFYTSGQCFGPYVFQH